jgi:hypothetical protein
MPYPPNENTRRIFRVDEIANDSKIEGGATGDNWHVRPYDRGYECVRPGCHFDLRHLDYYVREDTERESLFVKEKVEYDHENDFKNWKHIEKYDILTGKEVEDVEELDENDPQQRLPENTGITKIYDGYGFNYSNVIGAGNPEFVWYSHTDLELDRMIKIKEQIRDPLVERITEAKEYEDIYKTCLMGQNAIDFLKTNGELGGQAETRIRKSFTATEEEIEQGKIGGFTAGGSFKNCADYTCEGVSGLINSIPLECELISSAPDFGITYAGCDLSNYWWYGWLPHEWLDRKTQDVDTKFQTQDFVEMKGKGEGYDTNEDYTIAGPPYQSIIGTYSCPKFNKEQFEEQGQVYDLKSFIKNPTALSQKEYSEGEPSEYNDEDYEKDPNYMVEPPFYGAYGGFTADACGCIPDPTANLPDYISACTFPSSGEKYPEYLEYVRSYGARYWNTPLKSRLLRRAQIALLLSQEIEFVAPGNLELRVGSIIKLEFPTATESLSLDIANQKNPMSGKWLVAKIAHMMNANNDYKMSITCVRDSVPKLGKE